MNKQPEQVIETYLDRVCAQLEALPPDLQRETREELRQHLQSLVAMRREPEQVVQSALNQFGDPVRIGQSIALEWEEGAWDLSGLSLPQRLEKIRQAAVVDAETPPDSALKAVNWIQAACLLAATCTFMLQLDSLGGWQVSEANLGAARMTIFVLYFLVGIAGCGFEWQKMHHSGSTDSERIRGWRNIIARGGLAVLIPCQFLFHSMNLLYVIVGLMLALEVVIVVMWQYDPSRRARVVANTGFLYGLGIGVFIVIFTQISSNLFGADNLVWLLLLPILIIFGCWFWKRPQAPLSNKARLLGIGGIILFVSVAIGSGVASVWSQQKTKNPQTPMELVESWQWNGAYLAGDTDSAFMRARMPQALPALRYGLRHPNSHVRMESANTIAGLGKLATPLLPDIKARLNEEGQQSVRYYLAMAFSGIGDSSPSTLSFLKSAFAKEKDAQVKTYLAGSLARLTAPRFDSQAWQWLMDSLQPASGEKSKVAEWFSDTDAFWDQRWAAAYMLRGMGVAARPALPLLKRLRDDAATTSRVKKQATEAIQQIE